MIVLLRLDASIGLASDIHHPKLHATFHVKAYNAGRRMLRITRVGIRMPKGQSKLAEGVISQESALHIFDSDVAGRIVELEEGASFDFHLDPFPIEMAKYFREREEAFVEDASGKRHRVRFYTIKEIPAATADASESLPSNV